MIYEDNTQKLKIKDGNLILTTHRILFYKGDITLGARDCLEIPLWYIASHETCGGLGIMQTHGVTLVNFNKSGYPPFVVDYYTNVKKMS